MVSPAQVSLEERLEALRRPGYCPPKEPSDSVPTCRGERRPPAICPPGASACPAGSMRCDRPPAAPSRVAFPARTPTPMPTTERELEGRMLRYCLTLAMVDQGREMTVKELGAHLGAMRCGVAGRTSKVISDCLRWEVRRGRVVRVGRGRYRVLRVPRQTLAWMRSRLEEELDRPPRAIRSWPVGGWRIGWSSKARGRDLAALRARRRNACRAIRLKNATARIRSVTSKGIPKTWAEHRAEWSSHHPEE
jgi:hypothetical protein